MYQKRFGLNKRPFPAGASGPAVFVGPQIARAVAALHKACAADDAVVAVSGPVGVGKTTIVNRALADLDESPTIINVARMHLDHDEVLELLLQELDARNVPAGTVQRFALFRRTLLECADRDKRVCIVVEDAIRLGTEALSELEALTAADAGVSDGACIVLMGDPRLDDLLQLPELARLKQRLRLRQSVAALSEAELRDYLAHAVENAGGTFDAVFAPGASAQIAVATEGIPRMVNNLVESSLATAAERDLDAVTPALIREIAVDEFGLDAEAVDASTVDTTPADAGSTAQADEAPATADAPSGESADTTPEPPLGDAARENRAACGRSDAGPGEAQATELAEGEASDAVQTAGKASANAAGDEPAAGAGERRPGRTFLQALDEATEIDLQASIEAPLGSLAIPKTEPDDTVNCALPTIRHPTLRAPLGDVEAEEAEEAEKAERAEVAPATAAGQANPEGDYAVVAEETDSPGGEDMLLEPTIMVDHVDDAEVGAESTVAAFVPDLETIHLEIDDTAEHRVLKAAPEPASHEPTSTSTIDVPELSVADVEIDSAVCGPGAQSDDSDLALVELPDITLDREIDAERNPADDPRAETADEGAGAETEQAPADPRDSGRRAHTSTTVRRMIASQISDAASIDDVGDRAAEKLFNDDANMGAAASAAQQDPGVPANDALVPNDDDTARRGSEPGAAAGRPAAPRPPRPAAMNSTAAERFAALQELNRRMAGPQSPRPKPASTAAAKPAAKPEEDLPVPIEDQIDSSLSATFETLEAENTPASPDTSGEKPRRGLLGRLRRS